MHTTSFAIPPRRRSVTVAAALLLAGALAACGPSDVGASRLKALDPGASRDAVVAAMGAGPLASADTKDVPRLVNGFRRQAFITNGRAVEILWYREAPGSLDDPILRTAETPVVIEADTLVGWGWKFFPQFASDNNIPDPERGQRWEDSVAKASAPQG